MAALTVAGTGRETGALIDAGGRVQFDCPCRRDGPGLGQTPVPCLDDRRARPSADRKRTAACACAAYGGAPAVRFQPRIVRRLAARLAFTALGSLGTTVVLAVQVAAMQPWIADALNQRSLGYATPTMPTELLALSLAFAIALAGTLLLLARVAFQNTWALRVPVLGTDVPTGRRSGLVASSAGPVRIARAFSGGGGQRKRHGAHAARGSNAGGNDTRGESKRPITPRAAVQRRVRGEPWRSLSEAAIAAAPERETSSQRSRDKRE